MSDTPHVRPGFSVDVPDARDKLWDRLPPEARDAEILQAARELFAVAVSPFNDPAYHRLRGPLGVMDLHLERTIRQRLGDDELMDLHLEIKSYLPRRRHR